MNNFILYTKKHPERTVLWLGSLTVMVLVIGGVVSGPLAPVALVLCGYSLIVYSHDCINAESVQNPE